MYRLPLLLSFAALAACVPSVPGPADAEILERVDLTQVFDFNPEIVGVALDGDQVYVLDAWEGLYGELDGAFFQVADPDALTRSDDGWDLRRGQSRW